VQFPGPTRRRVGDHSPSADRSVYDLQDTRAIINTELVKKFLYVRAKCFYVPLPWFFLC